MAKKKSKVKKLQDQIIPAYNREQLEAAELPEEEIDHWMNFKLIPVELIVKADWNYKEEDEYQQGQLTNNIKRLNQIENTHVRLLDTGYYEMINGNHRYDSVVELEKKFLYCYDHGEVSFQEGVRRAIETNETKFRADHLKLSELVKEISESVDVDELLKTMPYSEEDIEGMMKLTEFDWEQYDSGDEDEDDDVELDPTQRKIEFMVPTEVFENWLKWKNRVNQNLGYDSEWKAFEFAIIEALNIPIESLE